MKARTTCPSCGSERRYILPPAAFTPEGQHYVGCKACRLAWFEDKGEAAVAAPDNVNRSGWTHEES